MQVYVIESYYDLERNEMMQLGRMIIVSKERGQQLINAGVVIKCLTYKIYY